MDGVRRELIMPLYVIATTVNFAPSNVVNSFCVILKVYLSPRVRDLTEDDVFVVTLIFRVSLELFL